MTRPAARGAKRKPSELRYWFTLQRVGVIGFQSFDMTVPKNPSAAPPKKKSPFVP